MIPDKKSPEKKRTFWRRLIEPSSSLHDENDRRLASGLAILLLALLPLYFLPEGIRAVVSRHGMTEIIYFMSGILSLSVAYIYACSAKPHIGACTADDFQPSP